MVPIPIMMLMENRREQDLKLNIFGEFFIGMCEREV